MPTRKSDNTHCPRCGEKFAHRAQSARRVCEECHNKDEEEK